MTIETNPDYYQKGLELAESGSYKEALSYIKEHLRRQPEDAQALNDMGAILHCLGRSDEAIDHLQKARNLRGDCAEIVWNLIEAYLADGRANEAMQLFDSMERMGILNADVLNRTANVFLNQNNKADAIEVLLRSLQLWPNQEILKPMLDVIRSKRAKIAFFCGGDGTTFLDDIIEFTRQRYQVRFFQGRTEQELYELMRWSDISWFEWCTDLAVMGSKLPKVCKNVIRLHRYEAYLPWPSQVNWENIDVLIMVGNSFVRDALVSKAPDIENKTRIKMIPNGVNLDKLRFSSRSRGKNLAFLGNLRMVKNPAFLLQCMQKLHYIDPEYRLFFGGICQDQVIEQYMHHMVRALGLDGVVFLNGWQEDISSWLADKHYIVSTSMIESQGMGVLEGMACGLKPVIHNFPGADQIFPPEFLFNISEEFCQKILSDSYKPEKYRKFVENNYSQKNQLSKTNNIFKDLEAEVDSQRNLIPSQIRVQPQNLSDDSQDSHNRDFINVGITGLNDRSLT
jgi:pentatricopeptide repeat protein